MLSWDEFNSADNSTPEKAADKKQDSKKPTETVEDFELSTDGAEVPKACSLDDPTCEACQ